MKIRVDWKQIATLAALAFASLIIYYFILWVVLSSDPMDMSSALGWAILATLLFTIWSSVRDFLGTIRQLIYPRTWFFLKYTLWFILPFVYYFCASLVGKFPNSFSSLKTDLTVSAVIASTVLIVVILWHATREGLRRILKRTSFPENRAHIYSLVALATYSGSALGILFSADVIINDPTAGLEMAKFGIFYFGGQALAIGVALVLLWELWSFLRLRFRRTIALGKPKKNMHEEVLAQLQDERQGQPYSPRTLL